jgi:hypothetical protein
MLIPPVITSSFAAFTPFSCIRYSSDSPRFAKKYGFRSAATMHGMNKVILESGLAVITSK